MYALIENGTVAKYPYTVAELRADNPGVSFPLKMSPAELQSFGVFEVSRQDPPPYDEKTENLEEVAPQVVESEWLQAWTVSPASAEEVAQRLAEKSHQARMERDAMLMASDWSQVADSPVDAAVWAAYRQALRDVPAQAGFPWEIDWPAVPGR